jgi:hypothetical protein
MELAALAIKARDAYKLDAAAARTESQKVLLESDRLRIEIERLTAQVRRLETELDDEKSNNNMLQRMLKRLSAKDK